MIEPSLIRFAKSVISILFLFSLNTAHAEQACTMEYDGDIYNISTLNDVVITHDLIINQMTPYKAFDHQTKKYETKYAKVQYKVLKFMQIDRSPASCEGMPPGTFDYDRDVTTVQFEASTTEPVFGSSTDGANKKSIKAWSLCKGLRLHECK